MTRLVGLEIMKFYNKYALEISIGLAAIFLILFFDLPFWVSIPIGGLAGYLIGWLVSNRNA